MNYPSFSLNLLKMGYFIVYRNEGGIFSDLIERKQRQAGFTPEHASYTHVEVSGGSEYAINISPPLSRLIKITKTHKGRYITIVRYKGYKNKGKRYKVAYFSATLCNKGYDFPGIFAFLFKWIKNNNRLYFCSEGALWSLKKVFPQMSGNPAYCMPADFLDPKFFEVTWEGRIDEG